MAERKVVRPAMVREMADSLDGSLQRVQQIIAHQLHQLEVRADTELDLNPVDMATLDTCGRLAIAMKRAKPDGVPLAILRRVCSSEQLEEIAGLVEAEAAKG